MAPRLVTKVEVYKDEHQEVYHRYAEPAETGWAWTHPATKEAKAACTACTDGTLASIKKETRR